MDAFSHWFYGEQKLQELIRHIEAQTPDFHEQAALAFDLVSEAYNVPKYPSDYTSNDLAKFEAKNLDPRSVYEEIGIIRFLQPKDDPRGTVVAAVHHIITAAYVDMAYCEKKHFKRKKVPSSYTIYYSGEGAKAQLHFYTAGEEWPPQGMTIWGKVVR